MAYNKNSILLMKVTTHNRLFYTTAIIAIFAMPVSSYAGPEGGVVTSGRAVVETVGNATSINQATDRAIIRWDSFDLSSSESVTFNQPGASSITVNRIRDTKASQINGHIGANGNIVLVNPNGVVFGATATVDVGGLVATTSDIEDDIDFMNGGTLKFNATGLPNAKIVNHGSMTVRDAGLVGLVAPHVENHGVIKANLGKAVLASGDMHTIDFAGDGLIKLEVSDAVLSQSVINTGTIQADGGDILLTAAQARGIVDALIVNSGILQAQTVSVDGVQQTGSVTLSTRGIPADIDADIAVVVPVDTTGFAVRDIENTGRIDVDGAGDDARAGDVIMIADRIAIGDGSYVTAAGGDDGGTIRIGGNRQGEPGLPTSDMVFVSDRAILNARSRRSGKGGEIILWSDANTRFYGHADVSGVTSGGFIEVSGKDRLDFNGTVDLSTQNGARGVLLLDPTDIVISSGGDSNISGASPFTPTVDNGPTILNVTTLLNALASGDVVVQTRASGAQTGNITVNSALSWSSGNQLTFDAHGNVIVNQTISGENLRFVVGSDLQINAHISGTGRLAIQQAADSGTVGIGDSSTGVLQLNVADLSHIVDGWNEIAIGKSTSTAAMNIRAVTFHDNLRLLSGTGVITAVAALDMGANNLTIVTDGDIALPNAGSLLRGTGTLSIMQASLNTGMGFGNTQAGTVNLTSAEVGRLANGWSAIVLGRTDGTGELNFNTLTWNDHLTLLSGTGVIRINGVQTISTGNNLSIVTDADIVLNANLTGTSTGNLSITQLSAGTSMGFGDGQAGVIHFTSAEVNRFANGWNSLTFGRDDGLADMHLGALTWRDHLTLKTGSGAIHINGNQTFSGANVTYQTDADIVLNGTLTGTLALSFVQTSAGTSIGIGDAQGGHLSFSNADIAQIVDGWASIVFGREDGTANMNIGALSWNDNVVFQTGAGAINIHGSQTVAGGMTIASDANVSILGNLSGTGTFLLRQSSIGTSLGIGTGSAGVVHLDDDEVSRIVNGWGSINFGRTDSVADMHVFAQSWDDPIRFRNGTGVIHVNGTQSANANDMTFITDGDIALTGSLTGSGSLFFNNASSAGSIGLGDGQVGALQLDNSELNLLSNGWSYLYFGTTTMDGNINLGARSWADRTIFRTRNGIINVNGAQNYAGNSAQLYSDNKINVAANLIGSSTVVFSTTNTTLGIGIGTGQAGGLVFTNEDLGHMMGGFSSVTFGSTSHSGNINVGASTWTTALVLRNTSGAMNINGEINMGIKNLTLTNNGNLNINAALVGTGALTIAASSGNTSVGVGTGQAGMISIGNDELALIESGGWSSAIFQASGTGALSVAGRTWNYSVDFRTSSGALNINGVQNMGTHNLSIRSNTNIVLGQNLVGSGILTFMPFSNTVDMGIGNAQSGAFNLDNTDLSYIVDGWSSLIFGRSDGTGTINVGLRTWTDSVEFRASSGVININAAQNLGSNDLTIAANANPVIGAALTGTGNLMFRTMSGNTTMGIGNGQAGTFSLVDAELGFITNGWNNIMFQTTGTGQLRVGGYNWNDNVMFQSATGAITVAGTQNMGANNLTFLTSANPAISGDLTGTGILTFRQASASGSMGIGGGSGTINISSAELLRVTNGWQNIVFGRDDGTGAVAVGANTWLDNVTLQTGTGVLTISGTQNLGSNNLIIRANSDIALGGDLSGTGNLVIRGSNLSTTIGLGNSQTGTISLVNSELNRILDGWTSVTFGSAEGVGNINIGTRTWLDPSFFLSRGNIVLNGEQTSTAGAGTTLVFATVNGAFVNNAGVDAINPGAGRYLVYSVNEASDVLGGIVRPSIIADQTYAGYPPGSVIEVGSQHIYSGVVSKVLFLSIDDADKIYGDAIPVFTYSYISGLISGDTLGDAIASYTMTALGSSVYDPAGTMRTITGNFTPHNDYSIIVTNGTMTVVKATITVEVDPSSRAYGLVNSAFNVGYSGFKNDEDEAVFDNLATASTTATIFSDVGGYAITASGASADNYDFVYVDGTLNVSKATLTATVQNASREYGEANPVFNIVYTGFRNGDGVDVIDTQATGSSLANALSGVGGYVATASGGADNNYNFNYVAGTLNVTKAMLVATPDVADREYGDDNPAFTVFYTGFKNGENDSVINTIATASSTANAFSGIGGYVVTASGAFDDNYNFTYADGVLNVNKAMLTATASSVSREYGEGNPAIGVSYSGFKNGEDDSVVGTYATASSAADHFSNVGSYAAIASGAAASNYNFAYVNGVLGVTKATLLATADNAAREYGVADPAFTASYTGFKNGDTVSVVDTLASGTSTSFAVSGVGAYVINMSGAADNNYEFTYAPGVLTITQATLTARPVDTYRREGEDNPVFSVVYTGFRNGENASVIDIPATATTSADALSAVGAYDIVASGAADDNYNFVYLNGVLDVFDAGYVPPSTVVIEPVPNVLPSTIMNPMPRHVPSDILFINAATGPYAVLSSPVHAHISFIPDGEDFSAFWQRDHFLIAVTSSIRDYYSVERYGERLPLSESVPAYGF